jgi:hypothetical protein
MGRRRGVTLTLVLLLALVGSSLLATMQVALGAGRERARMDRRARWRTLAARSALEEALARLTDPADPTGAAFLTGSSQAPTQVDPTATRLTLGPHQGETPVEVSLTEQGSQALPGGGRVGRLEAVVRLAGPTGDLRYRTTCAYVLTRMPDGSTRASIGRGRLAWPDAPESS